MKPERSTELRGNTETLFAQLSSRGVRTEREVPLCRHTTFRIGGNAALADAYTVEKISHYGRIFVMWLTLRRTETETEA